MYLQLVLSNSSPAVCCSDVQWTVEQVSMTREYNTLFFVTVSIDVLLRYFKIVTFKLNLTYLLYL